MKLERADADIQLAEKLLSSQWNPSNNELMYDMAAYYAQQGIEKLLKYILHDIYGMDESSRKFRTHKIYDLISMLEEDYSYAVPDELVEMSIKITDWEAQSRYGDDIVAAREDVLQAVQIYYKMRRLF